MIFMTSSSGSVYLSGWLSWNKTELPSGKSWFAVNTNHLHHLRLERDYHPLLKQDWKLKTVQNPQLKSHGVTREAKLSRKPDSCHLKLDTCCIMTIDTCPHVTLRMRSPGHVGHHVSMWEKHVSSPVPGPEHLHCWPCLLMPRKTNPYGNDQINAKI